MDSDEKELIKIYRKRKIDFERAKSKRKRARVSAPESIASILKTYFNGEPEALRKIQESQAQLSWPSYVGEAASQFSKVERIRGNTITIRVWDPLWRQQLYLLKTSILRKFQKDFPTLSIQALFFTA